MATEKRLVDANEAIEKINCLCMDGNENWIGTDSQSFVDHADVIDILSDMPTVDAVEVVRCNDCKHWIPDNKPMPWCRWVQLFRNEDDFCSYGERVEKSEDKEKA